jgi:hypothetical protein
MTLQLKFESIPTSNELKIMSMYFSTGFIYFISRRTAAEK